MRCIVLRRKRQKALSSIRLGSLSPLTRAALGTGCCEGAAERPPQSWGEALAARVANLRTVF
jgi:hypothetical protein